MSRGRKGKNLGSKSQTVSRPVEPVDRERRKKVRLSLLSLKLQVDELIKHALRVAHSDQR